MDLSKNPPYMFSSQKVDYFFRWHWWNAPLVFFPISALLLFFGFKEGLKVSDLWVTIPLGLLLWTLFEYVMHRFLFHLSGNSQAIKHFHYVVHGMHHAHATDPMRVIFPPFFSLITGLIMLGLMLFLLPLAWGLGIFASFILGYIWYEFMHYADHHIKWKFSWFKRLKRHHLLHHHSQAYSQKNFGVTTSLWDRVFNTFMA